MLQKPQQMPRLIYFNYLGMFSKILDRDFRNSFTAITQSLHVYCGNYLFHLFKCYCLLLHRNLSNLISIFQQFFLISQERMVYRYTCDFLYLGIGQFETNRSIFFYPIPQRIIFTHKKAPHFFIFGAGNSSYIAFNNFSRNFRLSISSTRSISLAPS